MTTKPQKIEWGKKILTVLSTAGIPDDTDVIISKGSDFYRVRVSPEMVKKTLWQWFKGFFRLNFKRYYRSNSSLKVIEKL